MASLSTITNPSRFNHLITAGECSQVAEILTGKQDLEISSFATLIRYLMESSDVDVEYLKDTLRSFNKTDLICEISQPATAVPFSSPTYQQVVDGLRVGLSSAAFMAFFTEILGEYPEGSDLVRCLQDRGFLTPSKIDSKLLTYLKARYGRNSAVQALATYYHILVDPGFAPAPTFTSPAPVQAPSSYRAPVFTPSVSDEYKVTLNNVRAFRFNDWGRFLDKSDVIKLSRCVCLFRNGLYPQDEDKVDTLLDLIRLINMREPGHTLGDLITAATACRLSQLTRQIHVDLALPLPTPTPNPFLPATVPTPAPPVFTPAPPSVSTPIFTPPTLSDDFNVPLANVRAFRFDDWGLLLERSDVLKLAQILTNRLYPQDEAKIRTLSDLIQLVKMSNPDRTIRNLIIAAGLCGLHRLNRQICTDLDLPVREPTPTPTTPAPTPISPPSTISLPPQPKPTSVSVPHPAPIPAPPQPQPALPTSRVSDDVLTFPSEFWQILDDYILQKDVPRVIDRLVWPIPAGVMSTLQSFRDTIVDFLKTRLPSLSRADLIVALQGANYNNVALMVKRYVIQIQTTLPSTAATLTDDTPSTAATLTDDTPSTVAALTDDTPSTGAPAGSECKVCLDAPSDHMFIPCGHLCCCQGCAEAVARTNHKCPICRADVERIFKAFFA